MTKMMPPIFRNNVKVFVVLFLLIGALQANAQIQTLPGYIITLQGDTLKGFIENRSRKSDFQVCYFKDQRESKATRYLPDQIKGYGVDNLKYYRSIMVQDATGKSQPGFGAIQLSARASLYRYSKDLYIGHDSLGTYSLHFDGQQDLIGMNKIRGKLNFLFADCKGKRIPWDSIILSDDKIMELTKNYNLCKKSSIKFKPSNKVPALRGNGGLLFGVNISSIKFASFEANFTQATFQAIKFNSVTSPIGGIWLGLTLPRLSYNVSLYGEFTYFSSTITGHSSSTDALGNVLSYDAQFSSGYLKSAFGVKVQIPARNITPFFKAGVSKYSDKGFSSSLTQTYTIGGVDYPQWTNQPWTSGSQIGIWFGAGLQRRIGDKLAISLEGRLDTTNGYTGTDQGYPMVGSHATFLLGIGF